MPHLKVCRFFCKGGGGRACLLIIFAITAFPDVIAPAQNSIERWVMTCQFLISGWSDAHDFLEGYDKV